MTTDVNVARNVCGDQPATIPVNIDCSLCALGFPQAGGQVAISFYGPICDGDTNPSPSFWLGYEPKYAQFKCPNPGMDAEPDPNRWYAVGYFAGIETDGCAQQYKFTVDLTAVDETTVTIDVEVYVLKPTTGGNHWESYVSWSETLVEQANLDTTRYRSRAFGTPGYKSITVAEVGGKGDPVSYAKTSLGMYSMRIGCNSTGNDVPDTCGLWDGTQWLTCLRAFIKSTGDTSIREFTQMGYNSSGCSSTATCTCDSITLTSTSPVTGTTVYNDATFVTDYGVLGLPGAIEAVGAKQQIQISQGTDCGIEVVVKQVNNGTIYICTNDNGAGWVVSAATVSQANSPRILTATRTGFDVYLYGLNFPNDQLLDAECSDGGDYPTGDGVWWCTHERGCVQSPVQPEDATAGPHASEAICLATGCEEGTYDPETYWCLYGTCVQSPVAPTGYSSGPHALQADCLTACGEDPDMVWICGIDAGCSLIAKGEAIMLGYTYYTTQEDCETNCPSQWWCTSEGCVQWWGGGIPPGAISGPYGSEVNCTSDCEFNQVAGFYCVDGTCDYYESRPLGAIGPRYDTFGACDAGCGGAGWYCVDFVCAYYGSYPTGATSGPHASEALCLDNCVVETVSPFPIDESDNNVPPKVETPKPKSAPRNRVIPKIELDIIKKSMLEPCPHLGELIKVSGCQPCGKPKVYKCAKFGECTIMKSRETKNHCVSCEYNPHLKIQ